jgi:ribosomal protein L32E
MEKIKPKFVRKEAHKKSKLGKGRPKLWKWRRQKGRHSKIRERRKGYTGKPAIGYGSKKESRHLINNLKPRLIFNSSDLERLNKEEIAVIAHTSRRNKVLIAKKAIEKNIKILNLNSKVFLEKNEKIPPKPKTESKQEKSPQSPDQKNKDQHIEKK